MKRLVERLTEVKTQSEDKTGYEISYWERHAQDVALPSRKARCHDCAITTGFYTEIADELAKESPDLQQRVCNGWFCHNTPNKMCKGVVEYLQEKEETE